MDETLIHDMIRDWEILVKRVEALPADSPLLTKEDREVWTENKEKMTSFLKRLSERESK